MGFKFIFVRAFLLFAVGTSHGKECNSTFKCTFSLPNSGEKSECLNGTACKTLDCVLGKMISYPGLRNSTKIEIKGHHFLRENYTLTDLTDFGLCGETQSDSEIECQFGKGLIIQSSEGIAIEHLTFRGCGSTQVSQDYSHMPFYTGIYLRNTSNVQVSYCNITNSSGIGMTLCDVGGSVKFNHTVFSGNQGNSTNRTNVLSKQVQIGGGLIVEFTYGGGLNRSIQNNNVYHFCHCKFMNNNSTWNLHGTNRKELDPAAVVGNKSVVFGSGGGLGMFFRGQAKDNKVLLEHCEFSNNSADWGGAYLFMFQDKSLNNSVVLMNVISKFNFAQFAGGGGRFGFFPQVKFADLFKLPPNYFRHSNCKFQYNVASWGGGISVFGTTVSPQRLQQNNSLLFNGCHWSGNQAIVGSALGLLSDYIMIPQVDKGIAYNIILVNCTILGNIISNRFTNCGKNVIGTGAIYTDIAPLMMHNVSLCHNNGTALVLDWSFVNISGNVTFHNNSGSRGGAVALYGRSRIRLAENSNLQFSYNKALLQGGAIYARSQGPDLKAFDIRILDRSTCFFGYSEPNEHPENWTAKVVFCNNSAPFKSGKSIYADTLQFCRNYGNFTEALEWSPTFHYDCYKDDTNPEIVTDPVKITSDQSAWHVFPGQRFFPGILLKDEKNQNTNGLLRIVVKSNKVKNNAEIQLENHSPDYVYVSDSRSTTPVTLVASSEKATNYSVTLSSVYTQIISTTLENISTLRSCYAGYKYDRQEQKCLCLGQNNRPFGFSRCKDDGMTIYLKLGYWGYLDKKNELQTIQCPFGYCNCSHRADVIGECVFTKFDNNTPQCKENRTGNLCGSCVEGYSVAVGNQYCRECNNEGILWLILMMAGLAIAEVGIIYFELDFFSGPLNSWLYTYHIIHLLPTSDTYVDPFIRFLISLTYGTFDIGTGKCLWHGMDALQKYTLEYLMPFFCLFFLYIISKILQCNPNISMCMSTHSFHHAFVTIVMISYASLFQNTMTILWPIEIHGDFFVYIQANKHYFGSYHSFFAIPALVVLCFFVIPFPFVVAFSAFFTRHFIFLRRFMPLFEVLQSPYCINCSWFASYYIFCRLILVIVKMASPVYQHTEFAFFEFICVMILMIFVLLQPYTEENVFFFRVDTVFLSLLCLINSLTNAMELNDHEDTILFFRYLIRILTYIPFVYSVCLLVHYIWKRWKNYHREHQQEGAPLLQE